MAKSYLQVVCSIAQQGYALGNVLIRVFRIVDEEVLYEQYFVSDAEGKSPLIELETVTRELSLDENNTEKPYLGYSVECLIDGYVTLLIQGVQMFADETSLLPLELVPNYERIDKKEVDTIPDHHLMTNYGGNNVSTEFLRIPRIEDLNYLYNEHEPMKCPERNNFVLKGVVIPRKIRVHLGRPTSNAENVTVDFAYYIKNVASSEIYPTWPVQSLLANIHAQVSLALNRVYTEWYRSKGYDFDITNNTAFDQAFVKNRNIYESISVLVDEVFNQYLRKLNYAEPFYAEYCDGKIAQCPGMKQWGTLTLANQGLSAIQILQRYYTRDVRLVSTQRIEDVKGSYTAPLRMGSSGDDVMLIQQQLNAIAVNYPLIQPIYPVNGVFGDSTARAVRVFQKQFNLAQDGVVGKSTWYKINYIYLAVRKLAELGSIGRIENEKSGEWPGINLSQGDRNVYVQQLQYYLSTIATFNPVISNIANIDSYFGNQTLQAVRSFQRLNNLTVDGIVGQNTWNRIFATYESLIGTVNPDNQAPPYPGMSLRLNATGADVLAVQEALNIVGMEYPSIVVLVEDGIFGLRTQQAVSEFQRLFDLGVDGIVGPATWNRLFIESNQILNGDNASPNFPPFPGTLLRVGSRGSDVLLIQNRLNFIGIYYKEIPSIEADGIFGEATRATVVAFQNMLGLQSDGIVGNDTWNKIMSIYNELNG